MLLMLSQHQLTQLAALAYGKGVNTPNLAKRG